MRRVRQARAEDHEDVAAFTEDTWPEREADDYLPRVFPEWVETDDPDQQTGVVEVEGSVVAVCQAELLGADEGWLRGIRVDPDHRGAGHGRALVAHLFDWLRERGAPLARNLVFDWNEQRMGQSRAVGFEPAAWCRFARVTAVDRPVDFQVGDDPGTAWYAWAGGDGRERLAGLAPTADDPWAFAELGRERFERGHPLALVDDNGVQAVALREGVRDPDYREGRVADWEPGAGDALVDAVRADAAAAGADEARLVLPATARHVAAAGAARAELGEGGLVFAADLTGEPLTRR